MDYVGNVGSAADIGAVQVTGTESQVFGDKARRIGATGMGEDAVDVGRAEPRLTEGRPCRLGLKFQRVLSGVVAET